MSNEKIIDLADLQAQTEELVTAIDAKDAVIQGNAEDYADSCLLEAKDYADDQDASVLQDAKDYADSAASAAGSSAAAASVPLSQKGAPGGVAELDANGLVPSAQLPSFVDDVLEYQDVNAFPATGETGKIYVSIADNKTYRWSGSEYTEISASSRSAPPTPRLAVVIGRTLVTSTPMPKAASSPVTCTRSPRTPRAM